MLDILLEALGELFGVEKPKPRQGTPRPHRPRNDGDKEEGPGGEVTLEDFMRQVLGGGATEPPPEAPPKPQARPRRERPVKKERTAPPPPVRPSAPTLPDPSLPRVAAQNEPEKAAPEPPTGSAKAIAMALRNNPNAAREAFIYSEIFGRPLCDR